MTARKDAEDERPLIALTSQNMSGETELRKQWPCKRMAIVALSCAITIGVVCAYSAGDHDHAINTYETVDLGISSSQTWFQYSWSPDATEARFVKPKFQMFEYSSNDFQAIYAPQTKTEYFTESSLSKTSSKLSTSMGLDASYGAFSGSIEVTATSSTNVEKRQMMAIFQSRAKMYKMIGSSLTPEDRLRKSVRKFIVERSSDAIIEHLGEFYASEMDMGGIIRTIFRQTQTSSDEHRQFAASVTAKATALTASVQMKGGVSTEGSLTNSGEKVRVTVTTQGGDSYKWLSGLDFMTNQKEWAKSFKKDGSNALPIGFKMLPIWNIVKKIDLAKGNAVESTLKKKWKSAKTDLKELDDKPLDDKPLTKVKPVPNNARVYIKGIGTDSQGHKSEYWMAKKSSGHLLQCRFKGQKSQSRLESHVWPIRKKTFHPPHL